MQEHSVASTEDQCLSALLFLRGQALHKRQGPADGMRPKRRNHLPTVLTKEETRWVMEQLAVTRWFTVRQLCTSGARLMECSICGAKACPA